MRINLLTLNKILKMLTNTLDIIINLLGIEVNRMIDFSLQTIKLNNITVIEVTNLLKTSLENISPHVTINLSKLPQSAQNLTAYQTHIELIKRLTQYISINSTESLHKQITHKCYLSITNLMLDLFYVLLLNKTRHLLVVLSQLR